jgi:F0F1-type ATP synthase delta subunit
MKHSATLYAKALAEAAQEHPSSASKEDLAQNLLALVKRNGDERQLPKIVELAERLLAVKTGRRLVTITSARPLPESLRKALRAELGQTDIVSETVEPNLVAGVKITINGEQQLDASLKRKLDKLFTR